MKILLFVSIVIFFGLGSCKKKERIPWGEDVIEYSNKFKENAQPLAESDLPNLVSYSDTTIVFSDLSLANKYSQGSYFAAPPLLLELDSIPLMRYVTYLDTIAGNLVVNTRDAHPIEIFEGYNLALMNWQTYGYTNRSNTGSRTCANGNYDFDVCAQINRIDGEEWITKSPDPWDGTFFNGNSGKIYQNYKFKAKFDYNISHSSAINEKVINPSRTPQPPVHISDYDGLEYLGRVRSKVLTSYSYNVTPNFSVEYLSSGTGGDNKVKIWDSTFVERNFSIWTSIGQFRVTLSAKGEMFVSKGSHTVKLNIPINSAYEELLTETYDIWGYIIVPDNNPPIGGSGGTSTNPTKVIEKVLVGEPNIKKYNLGTNIKPNGVIEPGAGIALEGSIKAKAELSWNKLGDRFSLFSAGGSIGPYFKVEPFDINIAPGGTSSATCKAQVGIKAEYGVYVLKWKNSSLWSKTGEFLNKKFIDYHGCDWFTLGGNLNTSGNLPLNLFSYDYVNCGTPQFKTLVYRIENNKIVDNNTTVGNYKVAWNDGRNTSVYKDGTIHPDGNSYSGSNIYSSSLVYPIGISDNLYNSQFLKTTELTVSVSTGKSYLIIIVDLNTYSREIGRFNNAIGTSVFIAITTTESLVDNFGYQVIHVPSAGPNPPPNSAAVQFELRGNGVISGL